MNVIRKAFLYGDHAGEEEMTYRDWAEMHIQDSEVAHDIAQSMLLLDGERTTSHENLDISSRTFEVYTIIDRTEFERQMNEYTGIKNG